MCSVSKKWKDCFAILCLAFTLFNYANGQNWVLQTLVPNGYNKLQVPLQNGTVQVNASITINSFSVDEKTQTITVDMMLCINWTDNRLQSLDFTPGSVKGLDINQNLHLSQVKLTQFDSLWKPLVYFRNSISSSKISPLNTIEYVQVWPDKKLLQHCSRQSITFICHTPSLSNFPFDQQYCYFELESFEKAAQHLKIRIIRVNGVKGNAKFRIRNTYTGQCETIAYHPYEAKGSGNRTRFSSQENCAYGSVHLVRGISYYVIRYYCPTFLMVVMGIVSFWLPTNAWPARIILCASVLLTLITTSLQGYNEVPSNDVCSLYWWLWVCQFFMYMCMVEYAFALSWQYMIEDKKRAQAAGKESPSGHFFGNKNWFAAMGIGMDKFIGFFFGPVGPIDNYMYRDPINRNKVDYFARLLFPFLLLLFVIVYIIAVLVPWAPMYRW